MCIYAKSFRSYSNVIHTFLNVQTSVFHVLLLHSDIASASLAQSLLPSHTHRSISATSMEGATFLFDSELMGHTRQDNYPPVGSLLHARAHTCTHHTFPPANKTQTVILLTLMEYSYCNHSISPLVFSEGRYESDFVFLFFLTLI